MPGKLHDVFAPKSPRRDFLIIFMQEKMCHRLNLKKNFGKKMPGPEYHYFKWKMEEEIPSHKSHKVEWQLEAVTGGAPI